MSQLDLFADRASAPPVSDLPDPTDIRTRMERALSELAAANNMPWPKKTLDLWRVIWPQMMRWLPEVEHADLHRRFDEQLARFVQN